MITQQQLNLINQIIESQKENPKIKQYYYTIYIDYTDKRQPFIVVDFDVIKGGNYSVHICEDHETVSVFDNTNLLEGSDKAAFNVKIEDLSELWEDNWKYWEKLIPLKN